MKLLSPAVPGSSDRRLSGYALTSRPDIEVTTFDKLTYAGNLENLAPDGRPTRGIVSCTATSATR